MSVSYFLVCIKCKVGVSLGKTINIVIKDYDGYGLSGFSLLGSGEDEWKPDVDGCADLQQFLMIHKVHELRVLPSLVEKYAGNLGVPQSFPCKGAADEYSRDKFFSQKSEFSSPQDEVDSLEVSLIEKLNDF